MSLRGYYGKAVCTVVVAAALSSCGSWRTAPRVLRSGGERPTHYGEVAVSKAMACTTPMVYDTGPEIRETMLGLIESATEYILIDSFLAVNDSVTEELLQALARRHREGVRIFVLADSSSRYKPQGEAVYTFLDAEGIPNVEYNPLRVYKLLVAPVLLPRDHRKFWIVDGSVLFLGGANVMDTSLRPPAKNGNRDFMVAVESPEAVEEMVASFVATWNRYSARQLRPEQFPVRLHPDPGTHLWLVDQNKEAGRTGTISQMFSGLFALASEEVWLIQPYTFVTPGILAQIREMAARGVEVNVMLSGRVHSPRFHHGSHYGILDILEAGGKVWIWKPERGVLHAKAVVVDRRWVSVGSANLNYRSFVLSQEANLVFGDPGAVRQVLRTLDELRRDCRPVDLEEAKRYRTPAYYFSWLWMQLAG